MNTLKNITLNNYTIEDFIKIKPIIFEYCINLTATKNQTSWFRNKANAEDLYQDVFLYVHKNYFNKDKELMSEGKFIQIMKNCTFWTYHKRIKDKNAKIYLQLNHFDDSPKDLYLYESKNYDSPKLFKDITDHPDYNFLTKGLKFSERYAIQKLLEGYNAREVSEIIKVSRGQISNIVKKVKNNSLQEFNTRVKRQIVHKFNKQVLVENDELFLRNKYPNYDKIFTNKNIIKQYSLYLQGFKQEDIAKKLGKSRAVIGQEIYRINQKIKKYGK